MKETHDPQNETTAPLHSDYRSYRSIKHVPQKKERLSRANKIFLIDLGMIAIFAMMIFLFRPYMISPNKIGNWKFSASASLTEDEWIQLIISAKPIDKTKSSDLSECRLSLFYEGSEWKSERFLTKSDAVPTENGIQWLFLPFPMSETEKISVRLESESESTEWIVSIEK